MCRRRDDRVGGAAVDRDLRRDGGGAADREAERATRMEQRRRRGSGA